MRERREAMHGTPDAPRARRRRRAGRWTLLGSLLSMFVLAGGVEASSASPFIEKVTPSSACPGEKVTFHGSGFTASDEAMWKDVAVTPNNDKTAFTFISSKEGTAIVPIFLVAVYAKNEKADLTAGEKKEFAALLKELVARWRRK